MTHDTMTAPSRGRRALPTPPDARQHAARPFRGRHAGAPRPPAPTLELPTLQLERLEPSFDELLVDPRPTAAATVIGWLR
jgi:hypothetical protein